MDFGDQGVKMETRQDSYLMDVAYLNDPSTCPSTNLPMDMDMDLGDTESWLDSLLPPSPPNLTSTTSNHHYSSPHSVHSTGNDTYDPVLSNSEDPFDFLNMEDSDFKTSTDLTDTWDKRDFAT